MKGHSAKEPPPEHPVPLGGAVIPPKLQPWRVNAAATNQSIARDGLGRWVLAAEFGDGFRIEVVATDAIAAAVQHEVDELRSENERLKEWLQWYVERHGPPGG